MLYFCLRLTVIRTGRSKQCVQSRKTLACIGKASSYLSWAPYDDDDDDANEDDECLISVTDNNML